MTAEHQVDADRRAKDLATLRARLALAGGISLHELSDGSFLLSRWNLTRPCASLHEVRAFCQTLEARTEPAR